MLIAYTDGACSLGNGGWGWYINDYLYASGSEEASTNNRMEITAVIDVLMVLRNRYPWESVLVVSDSAYVVNCLQDGWYRKWRQNGWRTASGAVKNPELWRQLIELVETHPSPVTYRHVRGHGKGGPADAPYVMGNDRADRLAVAARKQLVA